MSWQNRVISFVLRHYFRPASLKPGNVAAARSRGSKRLYTPRPPRGWQVRETYRPADAPLQGEWLESELESLGARGPAARTLLYLHGGGYYFCSPRSHRAITFALAAGAQARAFSLDYRLAPEHPFPAALDDALAAYRELIARGAAPHSIVLAGDSAGGGLVLATLVALRDAGVALPAGAVLFSPWTDLAASGASILANEASDVMFSGTAIAPAARLYLGDTPAEHPLASPLYANLAGLPPLLIQVSDTEVLRDDATRVAAKVRAAGGTVQLEIWPGLPHAWQIFTPFLPEARRALARASAFLLAMTSPAREPQSSSASGAEAPPDSTASAS